MGKETSLSNYRGKVDAHSKCNEKEAEVVVRILYLVNLIFVFLQLNQVKNLVKTFKIKFTDIAILTPYAAQKKLILSMIEKDKNFQNWIDPRVATIAESQGKNS